MSELKQTEFNFDDPEMKAKIDDVVRRAKTVLGAEPVVEGDASEGTPQPQRDENGKLDLSGYDIEPSIAHLYERATVEDTPQGPRWVCVIDEFYTASKAFNGTGMGPDGHPKNLGEYVTQMTNSAEGWKIATFFPNGSGLGAVMFQRKTKIGLPTPMLLATETAVEAPSDTELQAVEDAATQWAGQADEGVE